MAEEKNLCATKGALINKGKGLTKNHYKLNISCY
jgi:hypothetical protein